MKHNQSLGVVAFTALSMIILPAAHADPAAKTHRNHRTSQTIKVRPATVPALKTTAPKTKKATKARTATGVGDGDGGRQKTGILDGDGGRKATGIVDGDGGRK